MGGVGDGGRLRWVGGERRRWSGRRYAAGDGQSAWGPGEKEGEVGGVEQEARDDGLPQKRAGDGKKGDGKDTRGNSDFDEPILRVICRTILSPIRLVVLSVLRAVSQLRGGIGGRGSQKIGKEKKKKKNSLATRAVRAMGYVMLAWAVSSYFLVPNRGASVATKQVYYSDFVQLVSEGKVEKVLFEEKSETLRFTEKKAAGGKAAKAGSEGGAEKADVPPPIGLVRLPPKRVPDAGLVPLMQSKGVIFASVSTPMSGFFAQILMTLMALWLPLIPFWFFLQRMRDGVGNPAKNKKFKSKTKVGESGKPKTTFKDVAGCDAAKQELLEFVAYLREPSRFTKLSAKPTSGILMVGPPGTGKTLLARALAGEANVPFFSVSASEFVEMFVGRGAARVRQLFAEARKSAPCVVFIDEIDAVGMRRGAGLNEERDQTVIQLLTELDGFDGNSPGVLVLAATNRPTILDPALLRPGRFSRQLRLENPDEKARKAILKVHLDRVPFDEAAKERVLTETAMATFGFSGAQLANVVNEAALLAARHGADSVNEMDIKQAMSRTRYGVQGIQQGGLTGFVNSVLNAGGRPVGPAL